MEILRQEFVEPLGYDSIWPIGTDCAAQDFVWAFEKEVIGNGPFTYVEVPGIEAATQYLCDLPGSIASYKDWVMRRDLHNNVYVPYNAQYDLTYLHAVPLQTLSAATDVATQFPEAIDTFIRRNQRLLRELEDPKASPLLLYIGWGKGRYVKECNKQFDFEIARDCYYRLKSRFPANIGLIYGEWHPNPEKLVYTEDRLIAFSHPIYWYRRVGHQNAAINEWLPDWISNVFQFAKHLPNYEEHTNARRIKNRTRRVVMDHGDWKVECLMGIDKKIGYGYKSVRDDRFAILEYKEDAYVIVYWFVYKCIELFVKGEDNTWRLHDNEYGDASTSRYTVLDVLYSTKLRGLFLVDTVALTGRAVSVAGTGLREEEDAVFSVSEYVPKLWIEIKWRSNQQVDKFGCLEGVYHQTMKSLIAFKREQSNLSLT